MSKDEETTGGYADPLYLAPSDNPAMQISSMVFNGANFLNWSRSIKMSFGSKNKLGYIDGTVKVPERGTKDYQRWMRNDYMVRCWIFKSMNDKLAESLILSESAKQLWDELLERYGKSNAPQLYQLKRELSKIKQGETFVSEYYCRLKSLSNEIGYLETIPVCECDAKKSCTCNVSKKIMEMLEKNRVIDFLMGLDIKKYEGIIGNILAMDPLPNLSRAFHLVQQAEKQKHIQESVQEFKEADMSAFSVNKMNNGSGQKRDFKKQKMNKLCDHCGMRGHLKDECFKLVGYPEWYKNPKPKGVMRHAANITKQEEQETPLDDGSSGEGTSGSKKESDLISSVVQEVIKALNERQANNSQFSGFAGPLY